MLKLHILNGSTREGRHSDSIVRWVLPTARAHGAFEVELLDLREWALPMFQETIASVGDFKDPTYSQPIVKRWNAKMVECDALLVIAPEYNHSVPGVLKNAIDSVFMSFALRHKPVGFVGYSIGAAGGARAVEHLAQIAFEIEMHPLRNIVLFPFVQNAFGADGAPQNALSNTTLKITLDDLAWWGDVLKRARETQLPPARFRLAAAQAKH